MERSVVFALLVVLIVLVGFAEVVKEERGGAASGADRRVRRAPQRGPVR